MDTLERELASLLLDLGCSARQAQALATRLGWDGGGGSTLAVAAAATGYTRERVRQLEERVRSKLAGRERHLPLTVRALDLIEALAPAPRLQLARRLAASGISAAPFDPAGVVRAGELIGLRTGLVERNGLVLRERDRDRIHAARSLAARLARGSGAVYLRAVAGRLVAAPDEVRHLLELEPGLRWLDADREWLAFPDRPSRASRTIAKMLAVASSLALAELDDGLRRAANPVLLPRPVLRAYCAMLPWLELDPETDVARPVELLDPARLLTPLERALVEIFAAEGRALRLSEAARRAQAAGLNPTSATIYLVRSPVLRTVARGRYALRGGVPESASPDRRAA